MKNLHQNKNYTKYFNSINKRIKNMTTSVEITAILNLHAQIQQVFSFIVYLA